MRLFHRPLGLALGGGSAKGYAHIGVLEVLEDLGVRPDVIAGTSVGAIVGAAFANGYTARQIAEFAAGLDLKSLLKLGVPGLKFGALIGTERIETELGRYLPERIEDLKTPFAAVSCDLRTGDRVLHRSGPLVPAIRASIGLPAIFPPYESGEQLLFDGGFAEPVPVFAAGELGARDVVAVSLETSAARTRPEKPKDPIQVTLAAFEIAQRAVALPALQHAQVVIEPDMSGFTQLSWLEAEAIIERGREAAREHEAELRRYAR